jgi:tRNA1(Val) A37 N6-methylase TrmN6
MATDIPNEVEDISSSFNTCFFCKGTGVKEKRELIENKRVKIPQRCKSCQGTGKLAKSKRKNADGTWRKKKVEKSYPNFITIGPLPLGDRGISELLVQDDEELCYLVGNWRIYQRLDRHRYSTDDLVTSWLACSEARILGYKTPSVLDLGCGLGSVLLSNSWQFPEATCVGIEAQNDRYRSALRSVNYNIGVYPNEQRRIQVLNMDLREASLSTIETFPDGFDLITGTPPYFPQGQGATPSCFESAGCLFELRGGVEEYCSTASRCLRRPSINSVEDEIPSLFVMCNTSLASARVYSGCQSARLSVIKRLDVIPREGKPPLFSVFVIVADEWLQKPASSSLFPPLAEYSLPPVPIGMATSEHRIAESLRGETIDTLCVRDKNLQHTVEYQNLLSFLGKPHSANKEKY